MENLTIFLDRRRSHYIGITTNSYSQDFLQIPFGNVPGTFNLRRPYSHTIKFLGDITAFTPGSHYTLRKNFTPVPSLYALALS